MSVQISSMWSRHSFLVPLVGQAIPPGAPQKLLLGAKAEVSGFLIRAQLLGRFSRGHDLGCTSMADLGACGIYQIEPLRVSSALPAWKGSGLVGFEPCSQADVGSLSAVARLRRQLELQPAGGDQIPHLVPLAAIAAVDVDKLLVPLGL